MHYFLLLTTILFLLLFSDLAEAGSRDVLLLSKMGGPSLSTDLHIRDHLTSMGLHVTMVPENTLPAHAQGQQLAIISSSISAKNLSPTWRSAPIRLLTWENDCLDDLAMTGKRHDSDFGEAPKERYLWIVNAPQTMAAHLPAGIANVYKRQAPMSWGKPGLGATIIATLYGQPEKVAIFAYEKGATMDYESLAPEKRVMLFLNNQSFDNLRPEGLALFDAAVQWALH